MKMGWTNIRQTLDIHSRHIHSTCIRQTFIRHTFDKHSTNIRDPHSRHTLARRALAVPLTPFTKALRAEKRRFAPALLGPKGSPFRPKIKKNMKNEKPSKTVREKRF